MNASGEQRKDILLSVGFELTRVTVLLIPFLSEAHLKVAGTSLLNVLIVPLLFLLVISALIRPFIKPGVLILVLILISILISLALAGTGSPWKEYSDTDIILAYLTRAFFLVSFIWFVRTRKQLDAVLTCIVISSVLVAAVCFLRWFDLFPLAQFYISEVYGEVRRNMGTFIISGSYALWQGISWAVMIFRMQDRNRPLIEKFLYVIVMSMLLLSAIFISQSRNAILFFAVSTWMLLYWGASRSSFSVTAIRRLTLVACAAIVASIIYYGLISGKIILTARMTLIYSALEYIPEHLLYGVGLGVFKDLLSPRSQSVHNVFLDLAVEGGMLALITFSLLLIYVYARLLTETQPYSRLLISLLVAATISIQFFPGQLSYPLWLIFGLALSRVAGNGILVSASTRA